LALKQAERTDKLIQSNQEISVLSGIPVSVKDVVVTRGIKTTAGSRILENFIPPYSATIYDRLLEENAVILGKTNMDEFAMGSSTENSAFKITKNPWNLNKVPGGSSGGSAASVSSGMATYSIGSDTGGSIRQPAALCGVVGMKPTYGRVSRYGLIAMASSLDQIGPITKTVEDSAIVLNAISGYDPKDSNCIDKKFSDFTGSIGKDIKNLKIGVPNEFFDEGVDVKVKNIVEIAIKQLEDLGAKVWGFAYANW